MEGSINWEFGRFDYGLTPEEEDRAAGLHAESIVIDQLWWGPCTQLSLTPEMEQEVLSVFEATKDPAATVMHSIFQPQTWARSCTHFP